MAATVALLSITTPRSGHRNSNSGRTSHSYDSSLGASRKQARPEAEAYIYALSNEEEGLSPYPASLSAKQQAQIDKAALKEAKHREWQMRRARKVDEDIEAMEARRLKALLEQESKLQKKRAKEEAKVRIKVWGKIEEESKKAAKEEQEIRQRVERNEEVRRKHDRKYEERRRKLRGGEKVGENEWELPTSDGTMRGAVECSVRKRSILEKLKLRLK